MKAIFTVFLFVSAIIIVIAAAIVSAHIPYPFFRETQYFSSVCFIPKVVFVTAIFVVYSVPAFIALLDSKNTWPYRLILIPVWIVVSVFVSMISVYTFFGFFAYHFTQNHGMQFERAYAVSGKEIQVAQRSGETSYELKFDDKRLTLPMVIHVDKIIYEDAKLGDKYELRGIESKYGMLILDNKKM